jgi:lipoprotein-anchoring transpeptidase ErfK/SrfK
MPEPLSMLASRAFIVVTLLHAVLSAIHAQTPRVAPFASVEKLPPDSEERRELTRVQILLDRANFRPGKIDGLGGEFTQKAADRHGAACGLEPGTRLDTSSIPEPYREYTVTAEDLSWVGKTASTPPEQEKLKSMPYGDAWELVAEKFHCDLNFLRELNPHLANSVIAAGAVFRVPDVREFRMADVIALENLRREEEKQRKAAAARAAENALQPLSSATGMRDEPSSPPSTALATPIPTPSPTPAPPQRKLVILRELRLIELYEDDRLIGCFPCTPGSSRVPVPAGNWRVTANILMPYFRYDKSVLHNGVQSDDAYNIPPGPNNYVGIVWMGINRPSVGIHGTNSPDRIGRNESSGCIRLANWDAFHVGQLIAKGTLVEVR